PTPEPPVEQPASERAASAVQPEPCVDEPPSPRRSSPPRTMWEALAETALAEPKMIPLLPPAEPLHTVRDQGIEGTNAKPRVAVTGFVSNRWIGAPDLGVAELWISAVARYTGGGRSGHSALEERRAGCCRMAPHHLASFRRRAGVGAGQSEAAAARSTARSWQRSAGRGRCLGCHGAHRAKWRD